MINTRTTLVFFVGLFAMTLIWNLIYSEGASASGLLNRYANGVIEKCEDSDYRPTCYDKEIPDLMESVSMEDAFKIASIVQEKDKSYFYCHVLGHELSAREVAKDPSKWKDVVARVPAGLCSNGGIHGAFQEKFRAEFLSVDVIEEIKSELFNICEPRESWAPTGLEQGSCYHALGHLTMYMTNAQIEESLNLCDELALQPDGRDYRPLCYDGVFMQIFQPLEPEDFALIEGREVSLDERVGFCGSFNGQQRNSCWFESWPLLPNLTSSEVVLDHCMNHLVKEEDRDRCFTGIFRIVSIQLNFDIKKTIDYCSMFSFDIEDRCIASNASRIIETDYRNIGKAVELCESALTAAQNDYCFEDLVKYATFNFHPGSKEHLELCNLLPEKWKTSCINKSASRS